MTRKLRHAGEARLPLPLVEPLRDSIRKTQRYRQPQIIAFGGCGAGDPWVDPRIFRYVLGATGQGRPRVLLLTAASGDDDRLLARLHRVYRRLGAETTHWPADCAEPADGSDTDPRACDLVHVEGGNGGFLLHHMRRSGLAPLLREAWESGVVMSGTSAGAACWFTRYMGASLFSSVDDETRIEEFTGLGLLPQSICVHYDTSRERRDAYLAAIRAGGDPGFGLDHDAGLHFVGTELHRVVTRRPGATASFVQVRDGTVVASRIEATSLGRSSPRDILTRGASGFSRRIRRIVGGLASGLVSPGAENEEI